MNKALGQCAVTALVVQSRYSGIFADDQQLNHVWNIFPDGSQHDFCRSQFEPDVKIKLTSTKMRDDLIHHRKAKEVEIEKRYRLLKDRIDKIFGCDSV